jgi:IclR family transcriptional regulator, KDG regulon repressor
MNSDIGIQSVDRAVSILSLFTHSTPRLGITEMSSALRLRKPTVQGLVRTLMKRGLLQQDPQSRKYGLGLKIYELGIVLAGSLEINQKGAGPAYQLARRTGFVAKIAIWDTDSALFTVNIEPRSHLFFIHNIGPRVAAYCSGVGKVLLAYLEPGELEGYLDRVKLEPFTVKTITDREQFRGEMKETRSRGYSMDREENVLGLACIGVPIFGLGGRIEAAMSLSGGAQDIYEGTEGLLKELRRTSTEISRSMGYFAESLGMRV